MAIDNRQAKPIRFSIISDYAQWNCHLEQTATRAGSGIKGTSVCPLRYFFFRGDLPFSPTVSRGCFLAKVSVT